MKIFYQILIIIFIALCLYVVKDDFISVIRNISSTLPDNKNNNESVVVKKITIKNENIIPGNVNMPGTLKHIGDNVLNKNNKSILLKNNIIILTNKNRKENGNLNDLKENQKLNLSAEKKLQDMFINQYFEHISPKGLGVVDLSKSVSYEYILIGENLALGDFKNEEALLDAWMKSKGHRANILNKNYTEIGVAVGKGNFDGKSVWMAVQHFGTPMSACIVVDKILYGKILVNQNKINTMAKDFDLRREMIRKNAIYEGNTYFEQVNMYNSLIDIYNNLINKIKLIDLIIF
jgi:uncharacterized protein YkwD